MGGRGFYMIYRQSWKTYYSQENNYSRTILNVPIGWIAVLILDTCKVIQSQTRSDFLLSILECLDPPNLAPTHPVFCQFCQFWGLARKFYSVPTVILSILWVTGSTKSYSHAPFNFVNFSQFWGLPSYTRSCPLLFCNFVNFGNSGGVEGGLGPTNRHPTPIIIFINFDNSGGGGGG